MSKTGLPDDVHAYLIESSANPMLLTGCARRRRRCRKRDDGRCAGAGRVMGLAGRDTGVSAERWKLRDVYRLFVAGGRRRRCPMTGSPASRTSRRSSTDARATRYCGKRARAKADLSAGRPALASLAGCSKSGRGRDIRRTPRRGQGADPGRRTRPSLDPSSRWRVLADRQRPRHGKVVDPNPSARRRRRSALNDRNSSATRRERVLDSDRGRRDPSSGR